MGCGHRNSLGLSRCRNPLVSVQNLSDPAVEVAPRKLIGLEVTEKTDGLVVLDSHLLLLVSGSDELVKHDLEGFNVHCLAPLVVGILVV